MSSSTRRQQQEHDKELVVIRSKTRIVIYCCHVTSISIAGNTRR